MLVLVSSSWLWWLAFSNNFLLFCSAFILAIVHNGNHDSQDKETKTYIDANDNIEPAQVPQKSIVFFN